MVLDMNSSFSCQKIGENRPPKSGTWLLQCNTIIHYIGYGYLIMGWWKVGGVLVPSIHPSPRLLWKIMKCKMWKYSDVYNVLRHNCSGKMYAVKHTSHPNNYVHLKRLNEKIYRVFLQLYHMTLYNLIMWNNRILP